MATGTLSLSRLENPSHGLGFKLPDTARQRGKLFLSECKHSTARLSILQGQEDLSGVNVYIFYAPAKKGTPGYLKNWL